MKKTISMLIAWASISAFAQMTPAGLWHTIDDDTQLPKGEVRITDNNGVLSGLVVRALKEDPRPKRCVICARMTAKVKKS